MAYVKKTNKTNIGRPSSYTKELADEICQHISTSHISIKRISEKYPHLPEGVTIWSWLTKYPEFLSQYELAREQQAQLLADELMELTDNERASEETGFEEDKGNIVRKVKRFDNVQRTRLQIDTRKWLLSKLIPKKYGEMTKIVGDPEQPLNITITKLNLNDINPKDLRK